MNKKQQITKILLDFYKKPVAKVSAELFLSIGAVLFFAVFAIQPTLITMSDLIKELEDKREIDQQLSQKIAALSTAQTTYLQLEPQIPLLYEAIPTRPKVKESLLMLEKLASDRNLVIESIVIRQVPKEIEADITKSSTERVSIPVTISLTGSYPNISGYLEAVLSLRRTFIIDSIVFSRNDDRGIESLRASVTLTMPFYSENSQELTTEEEGTARTPAVLEDAEI